jgi:hypothetical protein
MQRGGGAIHGSPRVSAASAAAAAQRRWSIMTWCSVGEQVERITWASWGPLRVDGREDGGRRLAGIDCRWTAGRTEEGDEGSRTGSGTGLG